MALAFILLVGLFGLVDCHIPQPESEIRFGYGMAFDYHGQMLHGLNKYHLMVSIYQT